MAKKDMACRLRRSWTLSCLPTSLGSNQSSLAYSATAWTHTTWTACMLSGTTPYVFVRVRSLAPAALAFIMHRLCYSSYVTCASIEMLSQHVHCVLNRMILFPTIISAINVVWRCFQLPRQRVNIHASIFPASKGSPHSFAHSMRYAVHLSCIVTMWLT